AAYLLTHGHMDHIHALADVCDAAPAPVAMHGDDLAWSFTEENILPPYYTVAPRRPKGTIRAITGGQEYTDGGLHYKVLHTPGHAPGCVCFYFETSKVLFTGDTLFAGSVGRTDLPGGSSTVLTRSLASLARLPDDTVIYPGHGPDTTMAREKRTNYFMQQ
ncbi:MAG: MBL fold metallo-hydrolase, partial [bacterium]